MITLLIFAFISGLVTILAPCIWPILPIILSSGSIGGKRKPLGITLGIMTSFSFLILALSYIVQFFSFDPDILRNVSALIIIVLGLSLVIPALSQIVEGFVSRMTSKLGPANNKNSGFGGGFITGLSLGVLWAPCAGPILATIATLSATRAVNLDVILVTFTYVLGSGLPLFLLATVGQKLFTKSRVLNKYTARIQQVFGVIMILTAIVIYTGYDRTIQTKLLDLFPSYTNALTKLESNDVVQQQLNRLRGTDEEEAFVGKQAPEFTGISNWLNTQNPLTMAELKGKVVLIDFWTYTCINCIRTLPYVTHWYDTYKDNGFVVIGVHTPEFQFEKKTSNVEQAIQDYKINYPVAQDNDYSTWSAYSNNYWPAHYLIDATGKIREVHFGEGRYEETEQMIRQLLMENGSRQLPAIKKVIGETANRNITPETYIGLGRKERIVNNITNTGEQDLTYTDSLNEDQVTLGGTWKIQVEQSITTTNSVLGINYTANKVFLVMTPKQNGDSVKVFVDGKPISSSIAGKDVKGSAITLDKDRVYEIVNSKGNVENHILKLEYQNEDTEVYAFTFG